MHLSGISHRQWSHGVGLALDISSGLVLGLALVPIAFDFTLLQILSKDSVTVAVDAVVYFRISNATVSVTNVEDAARSTKLLAQTTLRNILGTISVLWKTGIL